MTSICAVDPGLSTNFTDLGPNCASAYPNFTPNLAVANMEAGEASVGADGETKGFQKIAPMITRMNITASDP